MPARDSGVIEPIAAGTVVVSVVEDVVVEDVVVEDAVVEDVVVDAGGRISVDHCEPSRLANPPDNDTTVTTAAAAAATAAPAATRRVRRRSSTRATMRPGRSGDGSKLRDRSATASRNRRSRSDMRGVHDRAQ